MKKALIVFVVASLAIFVGCKRNTFELANSPKLDDGTKYNYQIDPNKPAEYKAPVGQ
jgi:hypothetical protein